MDEVKNFAKQNQLGPSIKKINRAHVKGRTIRPCFLLPGCRNYVISNEILRFLKKKIYIYILRKIFTDINMLFNSDFKLGFMGLIKVRFYELKISFSANHVKPVLQRLRGGNWNFI